MKYFTDRLWMEINSHDKAVAKRASRQWGLNWKAYCAYIENILPGLPKAAAQFFGKACHLHDSELLDFRMAEYTKKGR